MKNLNAKFIISAEKLSQCPDFNMPEFPLLGRSNVGKSSFINGLANNKKLARTSNVPGKTRLINFFNFSEKFIALLLTFCYDVAGLFVCPMGTGPSCGTFSF